MKRVKGPAHSTGLSTIGSYFMPTGYIHSMGNSTTDHPEGVEKIPTRQQKKY